MTRTVANDDSAEVSDVWSAELQDELLVSVIEMLVAKYLIVSFVPIASNSFRDVYVTKRITEVVNDEQFVNAFASSDLDLADFADVEFKASAILVFTFVTFSVAW